MSALLPGIRERDNVVDLDTRRDLRTFGEGFKNASIRFCVASGNDVASVENGSIAEFAFDDKLAKATAIYGRPVFIELGARVAGFRGAALDFELFENGSSKRRVSVGIFGGAVGIARRVTRNRHAERFDSRRTGVRFDGGFVT